MNTVKSKYKNPDKHIERLKERIEQGQRFVREWRDEFYNQQGSFWFDYEEGTKKTVSLNLTDASKSRIGQFVNLKGEIVAYEKTKDGSYTVTMTLTRVMLRDMK